MTNKSLQLLGVPKTFSTYSPPIKPHKPQQYITKRINDTKISCCNLNEINIPTGATKVYIDVSVSGYGDINNIELTFNDGKEERQEYEFYKKLLIKYNEDCIIYKEKLDLWNKHKLIYDKWEEEYKKEARYKEYLKLTKEFSH